MTDVGSYPFLQAHDFYPGRRKNPRLVVVHATATGEGNRVAETIQLRWHGDDGRLASAHIICDGDSTVRCVHDADTAWHAKGANSDGYGVEIVGEVDQSAEQYLDAFSRAAIDRAAKVAAQWCRKDKIPVRRLTIAQIKDGVSKGITCHADVEKAFPSTGHTDPGPNFPWAWFLKRAQYHLSPPAPAPSPAPPYHYTALPLQVGDDGKDVAHVQTRLNMLLHAGLTVDGSYGPKTASWVETFQRTRHLKPDGIVGKDTAGALG